MDGLGQKMSKCMYFFQFNIRINLTYLLKPSKTSVLTYCKCVNGFQERPYMEKQHVDCMRQLY